MSALFWIVWASVFPGETRTMTNPAAKLLMWILVGALVDACLLLGFLLWILIRA